MSDSGTPTDRPAKDELDPELLSLRRKRPGVGPLLAASVVGLAIYLMAVLAPDLVYWLRARQPMDLGPVAGRIAAREALPENYYVTLSATADLGAPGRLRSRQDTGHRLVPVAGTDRRVWLHMARDAVATAPAHDDRWTGRLRGLSHLAFAGDLSRFVDALPPLPHFVDVHRLRPDATSVVDLLGDVTPLAPDARIELDERVDGVVSVVIPRTDERKDADEPALRAQLAAALGAGPLPAPAATPTSWTYEVATSTPPEEVTAHLTAARVFGARAVAKLTRHAATWGAVRLDPAAASLQIDGGAAIRLAAVERLAVYARPVLPRGAMVLLCDEVPASFWYVPLLFIFFIVLSAVMVWAAYRSARGERPPPRGKHAHLSSV